MATTSLTANTDIDYIQKDFSSSLDAIISFATVNFGPGTSANRLWTDFNTDSFSRNWAEIVAFISDVFFFYFDNQATQSYLQTASIRSAVNNIAKQFGFTPSSAASASGSATFTTTGATVIPRGFRVQSTSGQQFYVTSNITAPGSGQFTGTVLQGIVKTEQFVSQGLQNEEFNLAGPNVIVDLTNLNSQDITPQVSVNGNSYTLVSSFINSNGTDLPAVVDSLGNVIGGGGRVFVLDQLPNGTPFIGFGDGVFGRKLVAGDVVTIIYRTQGGSAGNIGAGTLTSLVDSNSFVTSVNNSANFSGGADAQSISQLRDLIPASLRTLERAVALSDYSDLLITNFSQVFTASAAGSSQVGVDVNIYVVPQGTGITKISDNPLLKNSLFSFIDRRKMVTTQFQILDAFGINVLISLEVHISDTSSKSVVQQSIQTALDDFFSLTTGGSNGTGVGFAEQVLVEDISTLLKNITGIERFEIKKFTYRPRINPSIIGLTTTYTNSNVTVFPTVERLEWMLAAAGTATETSGVVLFNNPLPTNFSYSSGTGLITYALPVDLSKVAPGDLFKDGVGTNFTILGVNSLNNTLYLSTGLSVNTTAGIGAGGSIRSDSSTFESFKCFRKILAQATSLGIDTITDSNLDLSVLSSTGSAIGQRLLLDNSQVFIPNQFATGKFYLVDGAGNIWNIVSNTSDTFSVSVSAVNNGAVTSIASGPYQIVQNLTSQKVLFNNNVFNIQYNNVNTIFSIGSEFTNIGTIGNPFEISKVQSNIGNLGIAIDIVSYDNSTSTVKLNGIPNLAGVSPQYSLIDRTGQIFNIVGVDNRASPSVVYGDSNRNDQFILVGAGEGAQVAEGFKVNTAGTYTLSTIDLKREGNISGLLTATILNDSSGLPNLSSVVATSNPVNISNLVIDNFNDVGFTFSTPPSLTPGTQYHLALSHDSVYTSSFISNNTSFSNTGLVSFAYNAVSGVVQYSSSVSFGASTAGNYFRDKVGNLFRILAIDNSINQVTLAPSLTLVDGTASTANDGSIIQNDRILVGTRTGTPTYTDGEMSRFNDISTLWSNSTLGPDPQPKANVIFSVQGTKAIIVDSNLTPALGSGATVSKRYYDDENQISLILGNTGGIITSATNVNDYGKGTVSGINNRSVDTFTFRTSNFDDDIINLRDNEIPQISNSDITVNIFGGVQ